MPTPSPLHPFFQPTGVAIIGASASTDKLGYRLAANLVESGYSGAMHFVNPKGGEMLGQPIYTDIAEIPDPVDLAALLVPAPFTPATLEACGQRGIRAAIILSGGFSEVGAEGAALEAECVEIAQRYEMRLLGPNCVGVMDTHTPLDTTFLPPPIPPQGEVAVVSHSGAVLDVVIDWARSEGLGLSRLVSLGNQADLNETDFLPLLGDDPATKVILLYLEGVKDGARFVASARSLAMRKPLVAIKVGRSASGQKAAASHTGALAGQDHAFEAAFRRAGVLRADSDQELIDWAKALAWSPIPAGERVAVLTNAGGPGVIVSDALDAHGLQMAELSPTTQGALAALLPPAASLSNPVDMLGSATPEQYAESLKLLLSDPAIDAVLLILPPPPVGEALAFAEAVAPIIADRQWAAKPVIVALMGGTMLAEARAYFQARQIAAYRYAEEAVSALTALSRRGDVLQTLSLENGSAYAPKATWQPADFDPFRALAEYSVPIPAAEVAHSAEAAARIAENIGFPVALKIDSVDISHKSDVGGVLLGLRGVDSVRQGYERVIASGLAARPEARIEGVLVQQMIPAGQEVIVGMVRDPQFGPLLMFGSGGVEVEGLGDVTFELAGLTRTEAAAMLERTWAGKKLRGFRNLPAGDRTAVVDILIQLSQLAQEHPEIEEIEINPLVVLENGAIAVDIRAKLEA